MLTKPTPPKPPALVDDKAVDNWIKQAPTGLGTGAPERKLTRKGKKVQISHTIMEQSLLDLEGYAEKIGQTRAAVINLAIAQLLARGVNFDKAAE